MQITESKLRQTVQLLLKEEVHGTIATVQHGSRQSPEDFIKTFENESGLVSWQVNKGAGSMYGHGLYTVWSKTDHQTYKGGYGDWIYKFKVNLYGFIIFDKAVCEKVYGSSLSPAEQLKKIGKKHLLNRFDTRTKEFLEEPPANMKKSSAIAAATSKYLAGNVNGIVFFGSNDGPVVLIYDPNIVTPMSYAKLEDAKKDIWTRWNSTEIKRSLSRSAQAGTIADAERLQKAPVINSEKFYVSLLKANYNNPANVKRLKESDYAMKIILSNDPLASLAILNILSDEDSPGIRANIARRTNLSKDLLIKLANDEDHDVRAEIAINADTPRGVLLKLADDDYYIVTSAVVGNSMIYETENFDILEKLASNFDPKIREKIALKKETPPEILVKLSDDLDPGVRKNVALNINAPLEALEKLANDDVARVLISVADNKNVTKEILMKLSTSPIALVRLAAIRNLKDLNLAEQRIRQLIKLIAI